MDGAGYETAYFGKYMNDYTEAAYVPPGWDRWFTLTGEGSQRDASYGVSDDGTRRSYSADRNETDLVRDKAVPWLRSREEPFMAVVAPRAPHGPYSPPERHRHAFDGARYRPPSFDEPDYSDKARFVPRLTAGEKDKIDKAYEGKLEELAAVDDLVASIVRELGEVGELENTYIVYASDNGYALGENRLESKGAPYDPSLKMPLVVRGPGVAKNAVSDALVSNVDLAPTFACLGGADESGYDGRALGPLFASPDAAPEDWRTALLSEHGDPAGSAWRAVTTERYRYARWPDGEELYDLEADPHQLNNLLHEPTPEAEGKAAELSGRLDALKDCAGDSCRAAETAP